MELFLADPDLKIAGYQVHFQDLKGGLFYFSHLSENCGTTLAIPVGNFASLSDRPILTSRGKQPEGCPNLCVREGSTEACPIECECLWVREIMQVIQDWEKQSA
jgi:hypothetical protein